MISSSNPILYGKLIVKLSDYVAEAQSIYELEFLREVENINAAKKAVPPEEQQTKKPGLFGLHSATASS